MVFLFVDVDDVSYVNGVMGYDMGDRLIQEIATLFNSRTVSSTMWRNFIRTSLRCFSLTCRTSIRN